MSVGSIRHPSSIGAFLLGCSVGISLVATTRVRLLVYWMDSFLHGTIYFIYSRRCLFGEETRVYWMHTRVLSLPLLQVERMETCSLDQKYDLTWCIYGIRYVLHGCTLWTQSDGVLLYS